MIDGEAIVCDAYGLAVFDLLRRSTCSLPDVKAGPQHRKGKSKAKTVMISKRKKGEKS
jgi:hypothetical protein